MVNHDRRFPEFALDAGVSDWYVQIAFQGDKGSMILRVN
jgi:hypothetical protein